MFWKCAVLERFFLELTFLRILIKENDHKEICLMDPETWIITFHQDVI